MKQALIEGAIRLNDNNMFEQGHGKLNILKSMKILSEYVPKVTLSPSYLDFTEDYMWPFNTQSLYYTSTPVIANITILNGMGVTGKLVRIIYIRTNRNIYVFDLFILDKCSNMASVRHTTREFIECFHYICRSSMAMVGMDGNTYL